MASSRLTILAPAPAVDQGYWASFMGEMLPRVRARFDRVVVINPGGAIERAGPPVVDEVVLAVAPSADSQPPTTPFVWIPRMGERVDRTHPWACAHRILLPLGAGSVDSALPVMHLGAGLPHSPPCFSDTDSGPEDPPASQTVSLWPGNENAVPRFLHALAAGRIPLVPADHPLLSYLSERSGVGLPCRDEHETIAAARYLDDNPSVAARMREAAARYSHRVISWPRVYRRLIVALDSVARPDPSVHVIVLNWNGLSLLPDCLESLRDQDYPGMVPVVVDNGSSDGSVAFVRTVFPECRVIVNRRNLGFAEGNNVGMRAALAEGATYVVLLNNDTRVARGWLRGLLTFAAAHPSVGAAGSRLLFFDRPRTVNSAGGAMNQALYGWDRGVFEHDDRRWRGAQDCLAVTGGSVLLTTEALKRAGLFDPAYFAYYEDNDLCHRIRLAGWRVAYVPTSKVFHKLSATSGPVSEWKTFLLERSRYRFILKNVPLSYLARFGGTLLRQEWTELRSWWHAREYRRVLTQVRAAVSAFARLPDILMWRVFRSSARDTGWTRGLLSGFVRPSFSGPDAEFVDLYEGMTPEGRIIVSCSCRSLRGDWSPVQPTFPKLRLLHGRGTIQMTNRRIAKGLLQMHVFLSPDQPKGRLEVSLGRNGAHALEIPHPGWHTLTVPARDVPPRALVELSAEDPLGINEVSLVPAGSPLLRAS